MSEQTENPLRDAIAEAIKDNEVILFMKGTPEMPACGFSARTVAALQSTGAPFAGSRSRKTPGPPLPAIVLRVTRTPYTGWPRSAAWM